MRPSAAAAIAALAMAGSPVGPGGSAAPIPNTGSPIPRAFRRGRKQKPWQRASDHTPRRRDVHGWLKFPGQATGPQCGKCKVAVKRIRVRVDGNSHEGKTTRKAKVHECPRCKARGPAAVVA